MERLWKEAVEAWVETILAFAWRAEKNITIP
jgi:hypothetical protein